VLKHHHKDVTVVGGYNFEFLALAWDVGELLISCSGHITGELLRWPLRMLSIPQIGMDAVMKTIPSPTVKGTVASLSCDLSYPDS